MKQMFINRKIFFYQTYKRKEEISMNQKTTLDAAVIISCITGIIVAVIHDGMFSIYCPCIVCILQINIYLIFFRRFPKYDRSLSVNIPYGGNIIFFPQQQNFGDFFSPDQMGFWLPCSRSIHNGQKYKLEDLESENGTRIQRGGEGEKYRVSSREPCKIEKNDIIYLGLAPIMAAMQPQYP